MTELADLAKERRRYQRIPNDLIENLRFRRDLMIRCQASTRWQSAIREVCEEDPIFFFNAFCWCFEPRPRYTASGIRLPNKIPFIAWEHQVPIISDIYESLGDCDIGVEKSRGEGMSWIGVLLAMHAWLLSRDMVAIGLVSKDELSVDDPNDPDSLMWKCDYTLKQLPGWLSGEKDIHFKRDLNRHTLLNHRNGSTISGYAATANVASGGRKSWFLMDELSKFPKPSDRDAMASTQHVTECRLIVSTPKGSDGAYYDAMHEPSNMVKLIVDWKNNPLRNRGMYRWIDGKAIAIDPIKNPLPSEYDPPTSNVLDLMSRLRRKGFKVEGRERSPWYDRECDRTGATPQNIAQELDRDYGGSAYRVFGDAFFTKCTNTIQSPIHEGDMDFHSEDISQIRFDKVDNGPLKLWTPLDSLGNPPVRPYVLGADVSSGTGGSYTSNSTAVMMDQITGEQVAEFASNTIPPIDFADYCIAMCKLFNNAMLGWEHNGPGASFTKRVLHWQYPCIYYRRSLSRRGGSPTKEAGWWTDERTKEVMFGDFNNAVIVGECVVRSMDLKAECGRYVRKEGKITNALLKSAADDSRGASHGDRTIAACVMLQASKERPVTTTAESYDQQEVPVGSMASRMKEYDERQRKKQDDDWDDGIFPQPLEEAWYG